MKISLIVTILNEGDNIHKLLDSIVAQTRQPDEVVICDGGSRDNTLAVVERYQGRLPIKLIVQPGANISEGRNAAITAATYDTIAVTDAGVRLSPGWLAELVQALEAQNTKRAVAGFFLPDTHTPFEVAMGATVLPQLRDVAPAKFMPSSRSVGFHRDVWLRVGGYPEWLDFCEDLILDFNIHAAAGGFAFAPEAIVYFQPRTSLQAFWKQYYQYARGDGKADLFFKRHLIRYLTYLVVLPVILLAGLLINPLWWLLLVIGGLYIVWAPYRRLFQQWTDLTRIQKLQAFFWVPIIRVYGDVAKMVGYPVGILWRKKHTPPDWRVQTNG